MTRVKTCDEHPTLVLFHWNECGYCKDFMPEFNAAKIAIAKMSPEVHVQKIELAKMHKDDESHYKIKAYPTLVWIHPGGSRHSRVAARTKAAVLKYVNSHY